MTGRERSIGEIASTTLLCTLLQQRVKKHGRRDISRRREKRQKNREGTYSKRSLRERGRKRGGEERACLAGERQREREK
eukprot:scaffold159369_cov32-Tisochrysis_lutea.AAC.1